MAKRYLNVDGNRKSLQDLTYDDLVWLYWCYIRKHGKIPVDKECRSVNNMPNKKIIALILAENNIDRLDFYRQFGEYGKRFYGNLITESDTWMIQYIKGGYEVAKNYCSKSNKKITFKCPHCGHEFDRTVAYVKMYGFHCQCCDDGVSYPNKFSYELLNQLKYMYGLNNVQHEYSPKWSGKRRYDNYFEYNGKSYILEMDGGFHKNGVYTISPYGLEERKNADIEKDKMAMEHNIEVIRIDCEPSTFENIRNNIINSKLSELFDISTIEWDKCNLFAMHNIVKDVCDKFKDNPNLTTGELGKMFDVYATTIATYLKKGTTLGWCNYDPKVERTKYQPLRYGHAIDVYDIETDKHYSFPSVKQAESKSKEMFGTLLAHTMIQKYKDTGNIYKHFVISSIKEVA